MLYRRVSSIVDGGDGKFACMSTIGSRIKKAREDAGLNQTELGAACGLTRAAISQWENGATKAPTAENIFAIADATGFSARWLTLGEGPEKIPSGVIDGAGSKPQKPISPQMRELMQIMETLKPAGRYRVMATAHEQAGTDAETQTTGGK